METHSIHKKQSYHIFRKFLGMKRQSMTNIDSWKRNCTNQALCKIVRIGKPGLKNHKIKQAWLKN